MIVNNCHAHTEIKGNLSIYSSCHQFLMNAQWGLNGEPSNSNCNALTLPPPVTLSLSLSTSCTQPMGQVHIETVPRSIEEITFYKNNYVTKQIKVFYIYFIMTVNLSWEETVTICNLNFATSQKIPVIVLNVSETKSDIRGYHAYTNSWKAIIEENWQTRSWTNIIDKYVVVVLKDTQVVGHSTKTFFSFLRANHQSNSAVVTIQEKRTNNRDGPGLQILCSVLCIKDI